MSAVEQFRAALCAAGLDYAGPVVADGRIHRFNAPGDKVKNSWFILYADPPAAGMFGCWKRGIGETWHERVARLSPTEWHRVRARWEEAGRERERLEVARHAVARGRAAGVLRRSPPARPVHPYLLRKGVGVCGDLRERSGALLLPLCDARGGLHSLQFIREDGSKRFLTGGRIAGCMFTVADRPEVALVLCEGYATGASIHAATGLAVVCAMHAGNLPAAAAALRERYPDREIILAADNDQFTAGNPGLTRATEAARRIRARLAAPQFQDLSTRPTDFNDLQQLAGAAAVAAQIHAAALVLVTPAPDLHASPQARASVAVTLPPGEDVADADTPQPFPVESLPPALAGIVEAVARCERVPAALPAVCAVGLVSAALGAGLEVTSAGDRVTRGNLFILADAESGSGKSQVFRRITEPFILHQEQLLEAFQKDTAPRLAGELGLLVREIKCLEAKAAKRPDPGERDRILGDLADKRARLAALERQKSPPCLICADVTSEKLAVLLAGNGETLFSASPEARQIVDIICGRYSSTGSTDEAVYLGGFSGDFLRVDRLGRDPVTLRRPCLAVLWLLQPDAMTRLFATETLALSGFLPRFLVCRTQAVPQKIVAGGTAAVGEAVRRPWAELIGGLLHAYHSAREPHRIEPSPEARVLLDEFFNAVVDRRVADLADVGPFASRYGEQAWRVALTFHAALHGPEAHRHPLDASTARSAIAVVQWFIGEQLRILALGRRQAAVALEDRVLELLAHRTAGRRLDKEERAAGMRVDYVSPRHVLRARIVPTPEAARTLLDRLERDGLLVGEDITPPHGGKTTRIYRAVSNPVPG